MEISIFVGKLQIKDFPTVIASGRANMIEKIISTVRVADLSNTDEAMISSLFFSDEVVLSNRASDGIVETPKAVAALIVFLAFQRWREINTETSSDPRDLRWLDPCSGAGVFSCEILKLYINKFHAKNVADLPFITVAELSSIGLVATLCSIKRILEEHRLSFSDYLDSNKLTLHLGDSLFQFPEVKDIFSEREEFDLVVGNPPYVRSTRIPVSYKNSLRSLFPESFNGSADLYTYFVSSGISNLRKNGVLAFISPAAFTRAKSGVTLRNWIARNAALDSYIDLDETKVFDDAELHAAIYILTKTSRQNRKVNYLHVNNKKELDDLCSQKLFLNPVAFEQPIDHGWAFHSSEGSLEKFSNIFFGCKKLNEFGIKIYSGVRPGYAKAYVVEKTIYDQFSEETRLQWFKPVILPANIQRWHGFKKIHFLLVIPHGTIQINDELLNYLMPYRENLVARTEVKASGEWFALRSCSYYEKMAQRKIAFPDLSSQQRFSIVEQGIYVPDGAYFIDSENLVLLGILNSSLARDYFVKRCSSVGNLSSKGRFRFKKTFVQDFPLPRNFNATGPLQEKIGLLVNEIISGMETEENKFELDQLISKLYQEAK